MKIKKIILAIITVVLIVGTFIAYKYYIKIYSGNVKEDTEVYIPTNATFNEVKEIITPVVNNIESFNWVANQKNYPNVIKAGKYVIDKGMSNNALIDLLRSGKQTPLTLTFNNQDTLEKLAGRIAAQLEPDSIQILNALTDKEFLSKNNFTKATFLGVFIPNSYEFYWNTSVESFRNRMLKEYDRFWNDDRIAKAKKLNMSKNNVITLASIVQKETAKVSERPTVAGLYLNRLKDGWALQADPTVIFSLKQKHGQDYEVKRVLNDDLLIDSPYNTYKNRGLPPAPIAMPDISSIDAVLNSKKHEYYYMCASVEDIGSHKFARTLAQHNVNAREYQQWLNKQGVNR